MRLAWKGVFPPLGDKGPHSGGSDHCWKATATFDSLPGLWIQLFSLGTPGAATRLGAVGGKGSVFLSEGPSLIFLFPSTFLSQASLKWPPPPGLLRPGWGKFGWGRKERWLGTTCFCLAVGSLSLITLPRWLPSLLITLELPGFSCFWTLLWTKNDNVCGMGE